MDNINDILSSLTDDDIENLKAAAASLFSSDEKEEREESRGFGGTPDFSGMLGNAQMMAKLSSIMGAMGKTDDRTRLIEALKPLLSEKRRRKADEAMQMMKLFERLPMITQLMGCENKKLIPTFCALFCRRKIQAVIYRSMAATATER